jgi:outer membrane protein assembly factor BamD (BamD/ComL family)
MLRRCVPILLTWLVISGSAATADEPTDRELYTRAATALLAKNVDQASAELSQLIELHPTSDLAPLAAIRLAECHLASSKWTEAIAILDHWLPELTKSTQARTLEPAAPVKAQALLGRAYLMSGQYNQLAALHESQKASYPDRSKLSEAEAKALAQLDTLLTQARQKQEEAQAVLLRAAAAAVKDKQFAIADKQLEQVTESLLSPTWLWRYQVLRAQCALGQNDPSTALETLATITLNELTAAEQATIHMVRLDAAIALGKLSQAQESIDTLLSLGGDDPRQGPLIALRAVELAMLRKDRSLAEQLATAAKAKYPKFESLHEFDLLLARNALARVEFGQARNILNSVLQSPPANDPTAVARAKWLLGESYLLSQDFAQAIGYYTQVIETNQPSPWLESSLMQRAKCYQQAGDLPQAISDYQRLVREFPRSDLRAEALVELQQLGSPESVQLKSTEQPPASAAAPLKEASNNKSSLK